MDSACIWLVVLVLRCRQKLHFSLVPSCQRLRYLCSSRCLHLGLFFILSTHYRVDDGSVGIHLILLLNLLLFRESDRGILQSKCGLA